MKTAEAIRTAHAWISMVPNGRRQYVIHSYSPKHHAVWVSHPMDYWQAQSHMWEDKVCAALELLGWDVIEAGAAANCEVDQQPREDWRTCVRRLAKEQESNNAQA